MKFPTTVWSRILSGDHVARRYTEPIFRFLLAKGVAVEDARDLTQEVLIQVVAPGFLKRADPKAGRFRNLLLAVAVNVWKMWHRKRHTKGRGGGRPNLSLDDSAVGELIDKAASEPLDDLFAQFWTDTVFRRALERLSKDHDRQHAVIRAVYLEGKSYAAAAEELKITMTAVRNAADRGKERLETLVAEELRSYCSTREEFDDELRDLHARLG